MWKQNPMWLSIEQFQSWHFIGSKNFIGSNLQCPLKYATAEKDTRVSVAPKLEKKSEKKEVLINLHQQNNPTWKRCQ